MVRDWSFLRDWRSGRHHTIRAMPNVAQNCRHSDGFLYVCHDLSFPIKETNTIWKGEQEKTRDSPR